MRQKGLAIKRAGLYSFFSFLTLNEPDADTINDVKVNFLREFFKENKALDELIYQRESHEDYAALFIAPGDRYVPPYESVYTDRDPVSGRGFVMGPSALKVREFYLKADLSPLGELPDHIGMEMAFMGLLCEKEAEQWNAGNEDRARDYLKLEKAFLQEHLSRWVDEYLDAINIKASTAFYRAIAMLAKEFIRLELEYLRAVYHT